MKRFSDVMRSFVISVEVASLEKKRLSDSGRLRDVCGDVAWFEVFLNDCLSFDFCVHSKLLHKS